MAIIALFYFVLFELFWQSLNLSTRILAGELAGKLLDVSLVRSRNDDLQAYDGVSGERYVLSTIYFIYLSTLLGVLAGAQYMFLQFLPKELFEEIRTCSALYSSYSFLIFFPSYYCLAKFRTGGACRGAGLDVRVACIPGYVDWGDFAERTRDLAFYFRNTKVDFSDRLRGGRNE